MGGIKTKRQSKIVLCVLKYDGQYICSKYNTEDKNEATENIVVDEEVEYFIWSDQPLTKEAFIEQMKFENKYLNTFHVDSDSDA